MRAWLVCLVASGCYLQPTVFEGGGAPPPPVYDPPPPPPPDLVVGCITREAAVRRRSPSRYWLGDRRVTADDVDRALAHSPVATPSLVRALYARRATPALGIGGIALLQSSIIGLTAWEIADDRAGLRPLALLAPATLGITLVATAISLDTHGSTLRRRAIDAYNDAATRENRCPPD